MCECFLKSSFPEGIWQNIATPSPSVHVCFPAKEDIVKLRCVEVRLVSVYQSGDAIRSLYVQLLVFLVQMTHGNRIFVSLFTSFIHMLLHNEFAWLTKPLFHGDALLHDHHCCHAACLLPSDHSLSTPIPNHVRSDPLNHRFSVVQVFGVTLPCLEGAWHTLCKKPVGILFKHALSLSL